MEQGPASVETFSIVRQHRRMLANMNCYLTRESRIIDCGRGSGDSVCQYRDAGFDAYGFDIRSAVVCRIPQNEKYFGFAVTGKPVNVPGYAVDLSSFRVPFEEGIFDFVHSTSTFEHVQDHELAFTEIARVLRPGGVAIHTLSSRYMLIEPHRYVPLRAATQSFYWFLGSARNPQRVSGAYGACGLCEDQPYYSRTGLKYLKIRTLRGLALKHFSEDERIPTYGSSEMEDAHLCGGHFC